MAKSHTTLAFHAITELTLILFYINASSTNSTLCAQPCYHQTVETHSCVSASCQVFAIGDFIRQSCLPRRKNASLQLFVELALHYQKNQVKTLWINPSKAVENHRENYVENSRDIHSPTPPSVPMGISTGLFSRFSLLFHGF